MEAIQDSLSRSLEQLLGRASRPFQLRLIIQPPEATILALLEPTSVVTKAWEHIAAIGQRAYWRPRNVLVTGAGVILCLAGVGCGGASSMHATTDIAATAVLRNNVIVGSVNANKRPCYMAGEALAQADHAWLMKLVTRREKPADFMSTLHRQPDDIKIVILFSEI